MACLALFGFVLRCLVIEATFAPLPLAFEIGTEVAVVVSLNSTLAYRLLRYRQGLWRIFELQEVRCATRCLQEA
jgi:hypothetical protein